MLKACEDHGFFPDTVQMPLNVLDASYDSFQAKSSPSSCGAASASSG